MQERSICDLLITPTISCGTCRSGINVIADHESDQGAIMAKRKKGSKVQSGAKLRRGNSAKRGKARKVAKSAKATKRSAKPKPAPAKKAARKMKQQPIPSIVETVAVDVIEQPVAVTEVDQTEIRKAS
jgi:hypothetical protein